jgi:hypothetical protein
MSCPLREPNERQPFELTTDQINNSLVAMSRQVHECLAGLDAEAGHIIEPAELYDAHQRQRPGM